LTDLAVQLAVQRAVQLAVQRNRRLPTVSRAALTVKDRLCFRRHSLSRSRYDELIAAGHWLSRSRYDELMATRQ